jgi:prepilin-type N-terminal cleavage/methylation domain-containing protein
MPQRQSGFTLIEIAIVLVIIGLLLGGILKGQELINSARVKNLATDFRNIPLFIYAYQDKFRALPGDDPAAKKHLGDAAVERTIADGAGNGFIDGSWDSAAATESFIFWQHVRLAGLVPGNTDVTATDYRPTNSAGGLIGIQSGTDTNPPMVDKNNEPIKGAYIICSDGILGKLAKQLDIQMDDGNTDTGSMLAVPKSTYTTGAKAVAVSDEAAPHTVCMGF